MLKFTWRFKLGFTNSSCFDLSITVLFYRYRKDRPCNLIEFKAIVNSLTSSLYITWPNVPLKDHFKIIPCAIQVCACSYFPWSLLILGVKKKRLGFFFLFAT